MLFAGLSKFLQFFLDSVIAVLNGLMMLFPPSPFNFVVNSSFGEFIGKINFFIPVYEFLAIAQAWVIAVTAFYIVLIAARWVKAIE